MRISLSRKILLVFLLLISFSLAEAVVLAFSLQRLHRLNGDIYLVREFQMAIHQLEGINPVTATDPDAVREGFEHQFLRARDVLGRMTRLADLLAERERTHLLEAGEYLDNYQQAFRELGNHSARGRVLHRQALGHYYALEQGLSRQPTRNGALFPLLLEFYSIVEEVLDDNDVTLIPELKKLATEIRGLDPEQGSNEPLRGLITVAEESYLNSLARQERATYLANTATHFYAFTDAILESLTESSSRLQVRLTRLMHGFLVAAVLASLLLYWVARNYFAAFLRQQRAAITAIEEGRYDYPLPPDLPADELGDLARFTKTMALSLQRSAEEVSESQRQLRASEEHVRLVLNSAAEAIYGVDREGRCTFCNRSMLDILCYGQAEELLGRNVHDLIHHHYPDGSAYPWAECLAHSSFREGRETHSDNEIFFRRDGTSFPAECWSHPIRNNGEFIGAVVTFINITQRKAAEQALAEEKERLAVTLRSIGDGVIATDTAGRIVLINKVAEQLCGWTLAEAVGRPLPEVFRIVNEKTGALCDNPVEKAMATGQTISLANHTQLIARDGSRRSIADSGAPIRDRESRVIGVVLVFRDVTEHNRMGEELLKSKRLESIGVLAGGIAHDFNNILAAILGNINLVRHIIAPGEKRAHTFLEEAEKASLRARSLTQQLLTFSRGGEPVRTAASIIEIIKDSTAFVLRGTGIRYEYDLPADLWPVEADSGQISQVVQNLVLNARHAMPGGGTLRVSCRNVAPGEERPLLLPPDRHYVAVDIADTGIGIPASILDNIFDPYFSTKKEGSGLGLAICHSIISKHQGHISVRSEQGQGSVFTFYLPAADATVEPEPHAAHREQALANLNMTVLIMDDDAQVRDIAAAMLDHLGCKVLLAEDGEQALAVYQASRDSGQPVSAVIMDLTIPGGMGGREAVIELLQIDPGARVFVSSGYSNDPILANFAQYGFCGAIVKPYQLKELASALTAAVGG